MPFRAGAKVGPYEILAPLGAGGMGEVHRARDTRLKRDVALKVLPEAFARDPERMARFQREAEVLASLNHPNIAQIYGVEGGALVMELVEGEPLRAPQSRETALDYARQIADALEAAHEKGITHRDLKPANIMVTPHVVKVLDFGLAAVAQSSSGDPSTSPTLTISPTHAGMILGTAAYMSPEQARGKNVDKRADIWAFGCVLYEMLTGKQAFPGETTSDILAAVLAKDRDLGELPVSVRPVVEKCLRKDPRKRWRDIGDVRTALEEGAPAPSVAPRRVSWLPWAIAGALAAALLAAALRREAPPLPLPVSRWTTMLSAADAVGIELSRDGTRIVYGSGGPGLMLRMLDRAEAKRLAGVQGSGPTFSPDGQWIVYYAANEKLMKIPVNGGAPIAICEAPRQRGRTWGDDDTIVYGTIDGGLMRVSATGGVPAALTTPDRQKGEIAHQWPHYLPGAGAIVFTINTGGTYENARIGVLDVKRRSYRAVVDGASNGNYVPTGHLVYARSGTLFAAPFDAKRLVLTGPEAPVIEDLRIGALGIPQYGFSDSGLLVYLGSGGRPLNDRTVEWVDRHGAQHASALPPRLYTGIRLSPDGQRVAATIESGGAESGDIWIGELQRGTMIRLTSDEVNYSAVWTPDGRLVTFATSQGGRQRLYQAAADGSTKPQLLLEVNSRAYPMSWTPDGGQLLFLTLGGTWLLPVREGVAGGEPRSLDPGRTRRDAQVSPDGRWIAYESNESSRSEIYVQPFPGVGAKAPVSTEGGETPRWPRSGRELFYLDRARNQIMAVDVQTGPDFHAGHPRSLFSLHPMFGRVFESKQTWDVTPDGERFLVINAPDNEETSVKMQVVVNWFEELRRRVPVERQ
ncbi:MAG TPA: protein kinase [Bryobacteraceae bacterium]|nr:protein kinase [Bryobacteraceae bacterium]